MIDKTLAALPQVATVRDSLAHAGLDVVLYDEVQIEPTDESFLTAVRFANEGAFDGFVSVGGGSVIDTCKAANLYATHPAEFLTHVKAIGVPNGIGGVGYGEADIAALTEGAFPQRRLFDNAPLDISKDDLAGLYRSALSYW